MNTPAIEVDWTVDPETHRSNFSPEFRRLVSEIARLIKDEAHSLLNGQVESAAQLIMAQLAHKYNLAPQLVRMQPVDSDQKGVLHGIFEWNGVVYKYEARPQHT